MKRAVRHYKDRSTSSVLKRDPQYLRRKRGSFVRMNVVLPSAVAIAVRERVLSQGGSMSLVVEKALRKYFGLKAS